MTTATEPRTFRSKKQRRQQVQYLARTVQPLTPHGSGPGRGHKALPTRRKKRPQGTGGQKYLMQRIARDHPDVLERAKKGEFLSVRAAAIAAGIFKPGQMYFNRTESGEWRVTGNHQLLGNIRYDSAKGYVVWVDGIPQRGAFASLREAKAWCEGHLTIEG